MSRCELDETGSGYDPVAVSSEQGNVISVYMKAGNFLTILMTIS